MTEPVLAHGDDPPEPSEVPAGEPATVLASEGLEDAPPRFAASGFR
jgi:hypothetical protein